VILVEEWPALPLQCKLPVCQDYSREHPAFAELHMATQVLLPLIVSVMFLGGIWLAFVEQSFERGTRERWSLRVQIFPDQRGIDEETQAERKRNNAEGGRHPGVRFDTRDHSERRHIADRSSG